MTSVATSSIAGRLKALPADYNERVYAGVLGKIIGVYLGRPFEGWSHERILEELGEVDQYVHEKLGQPLVVTDDDIAGTFTFLRALEDSGYNPDLSAEDIGNAWLNYLIEERTILWWGGMGMSTEHTAYLRLKHGIPAPVSGAIETNGKTIAEQIGSQIFIDGWAMLFPGDPEAAADFARRAASVSHDGEAIYGAQSIAAMEAMAFEESSIDKLLDVAMATVPSQSVIHRLIQDVREWHAQDASWYDTLYKIQGMYGYDKYLGNCHMVPNHALIVMALLWGESDFRKSQMIVNTAGWDTDCNAANVGAILGIKDGLSTFEDSSFDFRTPVADRLYLSTADGSRAISDAVQESLRVINAGRALHGLEPEKPKDGSRFHFSLPGSVQGFEPDDAARLEVSNHQGKLRLKPNSDAGGAATTPTFIPDDARVLRGYTLYASPTLFPTQTVQALVSATEERAEIELFVRRYGANDEIEEIAGSVATINPGGDTIVEWTIPEMDNRPIMSLGVRVLGQAPIEIDRISWSGSPNVTFGAAEDNNTMWRRAWVDGVQKWTDHWVAKPFTISQNEGTGLLSQGTEDWIDYEVESAVTLPLGVTGGIAARIGGMRRYTALLLGGDGVARLVECDGELNVLAETSFEYDPDQSYNLQLHVEQNLLIATIDGEIRLEATVESHRGGGAGFVITEGTLVAPNLTVRSI